MRQFFLLLEIFFGISNTTPIFSFVTIFFRVMCFLLSPVTHLSQFPFPFIDRQTFLFQRATLLIAIILLSLNMQAALLKSILKRPQQSLENPDSKRADIQNQDPSKCITDDDLQSDAISVKPKHVIIEVEILEKLLQRCVLCGDLPGGCSTGKARNITWTQSGTSLTATMRCKCKVNDDIRWSTQHFIDGTKTRTGNVAVAAAAQVAPIAYPELFSFFQALSMPIFSKSSFLRLSENYVWPTVEAQYKAQQSQIFTGLADPVNVALDGQYDSPGYSAELCAVSALDTDLKQIIEFSVIQKNETDGVSGRMEWVGVENCLKAIEAQRKVESVTVDKHPQVVARLNAQKYHVNYDPWHRLKSLKKELRAFIKKTDEADRPLLKSLSRRLILQIWSAIEQSNGDPKICQELVFSFFLHIQGIHSWSKDQKFADLIVAISPTKTCARFSKERFEKTTGCSHAPGQINDHLKVPNTSPYFQALLSIVAKTAFMNDLDRMRITSATSAVESFHSICIKYRPKRKFFNKRGFIRRTMLSVLHFNGNRRAELRGDRVVQEIYRCFSKSKGQFTNKIKMGPSDESWKTEIVLGAIQLKKQMGPGHRSIQDNDDEIDILASRLAAIADFGDDNGDESDVSE